MVVLPQDIAEDLAHEAYEQERSEVFVMSEVKAGVSTFGLYPPNDATLERYQAWLTQDE